MLLKKNNGQFIWYGLVIKQFRVQFGFPLERFLFS